MKEKNVIIVPVDALYARDLFVDLAQTYETITIHTGKYHYRIIAENQKKEDESE